MNIAIIGYGKMGREIESLAKQFGHQVSIIIDNEEDWSKQADLLSGADVAIEFTFPEKALENILRCFHARVPVVCGTTGWYDQLEEVRNICYEGQHALFYAPNFSIGVNIFFEVNRNLARLMADLPAYRISLSETHHSQKKDAPSGTAVMLAQDIIASRKDIKGWKLGSESSRENEMPIKAIRTGTIPGTHQIIYSSETDTIEINHIAHNRQGFAQGALLAASWIKKRTGVYTMKDLLNI